MPASPTATQCNPPAAAPPGSPPAGAWIALSPAAGPPGTVVCVTGHVAGGPTASRASTDQRQGTVCWDGCRTGLTEQGVTVDWSATRAGDFAARLRVPAVPWLTAEGPRPLTPGTYRIGVQCLAPTAGGCALRPAQASAAFRLTGPTATRCLPGRPCATLHLSPPSGPPGTVVRVSGWAPLTAVIGRPFGYSLVLRQHGQPASPSDDQVGQVQQAMDGSITGSLRLPTAVGAQPLAPGRYDLALEDFFLTAAATAKPASGPGFTSVPVTKGSSVVGVRVILAPTPVTVSPAPGWASVGSLPPIWVHPSASLLGGGMAVAGLAAGSGSASTSPSGSPAPATAQPSPSSGRLAYCVPGGIRLSADSGRTWRTVPTTGVTAAAAATDYVVPAYQGKTPPPDCTSVTLDPTHAGSLFAAFNLVSKPCECAPPYISLGYVTTDGGATWTPVPEPSGFGGSGPGGPGFGGFQVQGGSVVALFSHAASAPGHAPTLAVESTSDGGRTWRPSALACPDSGPCVRWGPAPSSISACMASFPQPVEVSTDGGRTWAPPAWPRAVDLCAGGGELAALTRTTVALLAGRSPYPLALSRDGGRSWSYVSLPALPGSADSGPGFPDLTILPDGSLLAYAPAAVSAGSAAGGGSGGAAGSGGGPSGAWTLLPPGAASWCTLSAPALPAVQTPTPPVAAGGRLWWLLPAPGTGSGAAAPAPVSVALAGLGCGAGGQG